MPSKEVTEPELVACSMIRDGVIALSVCPYLIRAFSATYLLFTDLISRGVRGFPGLFSQPGLEHLQGHASTLVLGPHVNANREP